MRIPNVDFLRTHLRLSRQFLPSLVCLVLGASVDTGFAHASAPPSPDSLPPIPTPISRSAALDTAILRCRDASDLFALGVVDYNGGNPDQAIQLFESALKLRPQYADASYNLGLAYHAKKDYKAAIASFSKVIELKPKLADAWVRRGVSYAASGDFDRAMNDFTQALALNPNNFGASIQYLTIEPKPDPLIYYNLGAVNYAGTHYDASIDAFKKFISLAPPDQIADSYSFLGDAYTAKKDYTDAIPAYTKYITAHPEDKTGAALKGRGLAYLQSKQNAESAADYKKYLVLQPNDKEAQNNLIVALSGDKNTSPAVLMAQLTDAVAKDPGNTTLRTTLAKMQIEAKDYPAAITQYNAILAAKPDDSAALYNRGVAYGLEKDTAKAAVDFGAYTKLKPADAAGWNNLGVFLGQQKDYKGSIAAFTQYISLKPADPDFIEVYKNRGIAYYNLQDWKNAQNDLTQYNTAKPGDKDVQNLLAQIFAQQTGEQSIPLEDAIKHAPGITDPNVWFNVGIARLNKKHYEDAVAAFTMSYSLQPDADTLFQRALANYDLGESGDVAAYAQAEADARSAFALKADYSEALLLMADAEYAERKYARAAADYSVYAAMLGVPAENKVYAQKRMLKAIINDKTVHDENTSTAKPSYYDIAILAATSCKALADADQLDTTKCSAEYDMAITLYDNAARIASATPKQKADALYNEATTLEATASSTNSDDPLKVAITAWGTWVTMSAADPELPKFKQHISDLQTKVAKEN